MADFRKLILALIAGVLLFTAVASAQPYSCSTVPTQTMVRREGLAEKVGDIVLYCSGTVGSGMLDEQGRLRVNIRLTADAVNITSNLLNGWTTPLEPVSDATMILDEGASGFKGYDSGTANGPLVPFLDGSQNVYQAVKVQNAENAVEWQGVVIAGPGSNPFTVIRLTNVRVNVARLAVNTSIAVHINITSPNGFPILNSNNLIVANVGQETVFSVVENPTINSFDACVEPRGDRLNNIFTLRAREGFAWAFRPMGDANVDNGFPGTNFRNESGFSPASLSGGGALVAWPGTATTGLGQANQGTQIRWLLQGIPLAGVTLHIPADINSGTGLILHTTVTNPVISSTGTATILYEVMSASGQSLSLPEDVDIPVDVILDHSVPAPADTTIQAHGSLFPLSAVGTANLLAPEPRFMDLNAGPPMQQIDAFDFNGTCATTLLFPYITNQAGFDTGLVISNTSMDPMGTAAQHGTCSLNYYGFVGNHLQVPLLTDTVIKGLAVTPDIPSGGQLILSLSGGGGFVDPMGTTSAVACTNCSPAGQFQGYMIATCNFQYAHGYAFISDLGATKLAQGYLALVIPRRHQVLGVGDRATASHAFNPKQNQGETLGN